MLAVLGATQFAQEQLAIDGQGAGQQTLGRVPRPLAGDLAAAGLAPRAPGLFEALVGGLVELAVAVLDLALEPERHRPAHVVDDHLREPPRERVVLRRLARARAQGAQLEAQRGVDELRLGQEARG